MEAKVMKCDACVYIFWRKKLNLVTNFDFSAHSFKRS